MQIQARNLVIVTLVATLVVVTCWKQSPGQGESAKPAGAADSKLKVLLKEKLAIAQEAATLTTTAYQSGGTSFSEVVEANQAVGKAQLDLCDTNAERVAVLERMLAQARDFETITTERVKTAAVPKTTLLKAKLSRLDVEVALERAKEK